MKKIFFTLALLLQLSVAFGQTVGSTVKSKTIYNSSGILISYYITYYGVGDCHNNTKGGLKKYRIDFNAKNNSGNTVKLAGSRIDLDDNLDRYKYDCYSSEAILLGSYPGFEDFGTLIPNENVKATKYVYMLESTNELPSVTYNIIPTIIPNKQAQNATSGQQSNTNISTPSSNKETQQQNNLTKQNIDEQIKALTKRRNELCLQVVKIDNNTYNTICDSWQGRNQITTKEQTLAYLREDIRKLELRLNLSSNITSNATNNSQSNSTGLPTVNTNNNSVQKNELANVEKKLQEQKIESQRQDQESKQAVATFNNTVKDFMQSIPNVQEDRETLDKMKSFELAKMEVEPEFNTITTPNDFNKVSLTTLNYKNLLKTGNVAVSIIKSALSDVDRAKKEAFTSAKIQAAFLGANTIMVKVLEIGSKKLGGPYNYPTTDLFGIAYSDKKINFEQLEQTLKSNKNLKVIECYSHIINKDDFKIEKCNKTISITEINKRDDKVIITANIDGVVQNSFTGINFSPNGFTIMFKEGDEKKQKLFNYIVKID